MNEEVTLFPRDYFADGIREARSARLGGGQLEAGFHPPRPFLGDRRSLAACRRDKYFNNLNGRTGPN
jgi:hypothetical protein